MASSKRQHLFLDKLSWKNSLMEDSHESENILNPYNEGNRSTSLAEDIH